MKNTFNNFVNGIGNTPLIRLNGPSELTGCNIYGKAEFLNPGGSIKDRAAWALIKDAEEKKLISKGGTIVEGTFNLIRGVFPMPSMKLLNVFFI